MNSIKLSEYRIGIKFDKDPLAVEQNKYLIKILNVYIVYEYSGYGITFDSAGSWSFGNDTAGNAIIFGVDNSSFFHSDSCKNNFLILGEGQTFRINGSLDQQRRNLVLFLLKQTQNFV